MASPSAIAQSRQASRNRPTGTLCTGTSSKCSCVPRDEVVPDPAQVIEERVVVERLDRLSLQRPPGCEHRAAVVCLPALRDRLATAARRAPRRGVPRSAPEAGVDPRHDLQDDRGRWAARPCPRLGSGAPTRAHARVAVVVHEAHVEVVDRQPVPLGTPRKPSLNASGARSWNTRGCQPRTCTSSSCHHPPPGGSHVTVTAPSFAPDRARRRPACGSPIAVTWPISSASSPQ